MKKPVILLWFSLLSNSFLMNAQAIADYTVYYNFMFITDTVNNTFSTPEAFMLFKVGQESRFMSSARHYNDSTLAIFRENYPEPDFKSQKEIQKYVNLVMEKVSRKSVRSDYKIVKNFKTGSIVSVGTYPSLPIEYMEEPMALAWSLTGETDTILGLPCMQAVTNYGGRRYYAWFTLEVPINDGPYTFQGLPGLILKVMDDKGWYIFTANNIITEKTNVTIGDWINDKSQKIDRKTFVEKTIRYKQSPSMPPGVIDFPQERLLEQKEAFKKRFDLLLEQY